MVAPDVHFRGCASIAQQMIFSNLAFDMPAAQWTCLLGVSGVGKSTILRLLAGLGDHVTFDGVISASDQSPIAPRCAFMAQDDLLLPWASAFDNVTLGARLRGDPVDRDRALHLLDGVGLRDHAHKKRDALSGGQRQRVALARTLLEDKPIILLDEPFSALDARTRADMQELAHHVLKGKTVLLITHDPGEAARLADHLLVMPAADMPVRHIKTPNSATPRQIDSRDTLQIQADLLTLLRGAG